MGTAHRIKIVLFQQNNISAHGFFVHHLPMLRMMLMTIGAAYQQRLTVQFELPMADFYLAKPNVIGFNVNNAALLVT